MSELASPTGSIENENDDTDFFDDMQWVKATNSLADDTDSQFTPSNILSNVNDDVASSLTPVNFSTENTSHLLQTIVDAISKCFSNRPVDDHHVNGSQLPLQLLTYETDIIKNNRYVQYSTFRSKIR